MKALTIWQPWATLIVEQWKPFEFRDWPAPRAIVGQRIVIHAAKRPLKITELHAIIDYTLSADGRRDGIDLRAADLLEKVWREKVSLPFSVALGTARLGEPRGYRDKWAWPMLDIEKWPQPVPAKGAQGFWKWRA